AAPARGGSPSPPAPRHSSGMLAAKARQNAAPPEVETGRAELPRATAALSAYNIADLRAESRKLLRKAAPPSSSVFSKNRRRAHRNAPHRAPTRRRQAAHPRRAPRGTKATPNRFRTS